MRVGEGALHGLAVADRGDAEAFAGQHAADQLADLAIVVDDQDVRRGVHGRTIGARRHTPQGKSVTRFVGRPVCHILAQTCGIGDKAW